MPANRDFVSKICFIFALPNKRKRGGQKQKFAGLFVFVENLFLICTAFERLCLLFYVLREMITVGCRGIYLRVISDYTAYSSNVDLIAD
jgi:hypothetical protein